MKTVMIVDDDPGHCANLIDILELEGYQALSAGTVTEALSLARASWPQVALLDQKLPDGTGTGLLASIKKMNPECYCIIITAHADLASAVAAMDEGAYCYLRKPFRLEELLGLLERIFEAIRLKEQKRQAERALRESEEMLAGIINAVADAMMMINERDEVVWTNEMAKKIFGQNADGEKFYRVIYRRPEPPEYCAVRKCFADGRQHDMEVLFTNLEGLDQNFWCTTSVMLRDGDGKPKRVVLVCRNTTEKKGLEAQVMRNAQLAALGELAAGIAHEINNPINGIINYAQILIDRQEEGAEDSGIPSRVIREGERIASIVNNLLSFARDRKDEREIVSVRDILHEALDLTQTMLKKESIRILLNADDELPLCQGSFQQIQQVFLNIISNARYALNQKYPGYDQDKILDIRLETTEKNGVGYVRISFLDHGTGIPKSLIDKVCNPFFSTKPMDIGTGLGLSISYGIVKDHGGELWIDSREGESTSVVIDIPAHCQEDR